MAKQNRVQSTTVQFNVQGIQEIFGYQKKIKDAMKEIIAERKKSLAESGKTGAEYEKELNLIKQLEAEVKRYGSTANNLQKVLENVGAASAKQLQQAEKALKNIRDGIKFDGKKMGVADAEKEVGLLNNAIQRVHKQMEMIQAEAHNATSFKVMGKSVEQLNNYIINFERNAQYMTSQMQNGKQVFAEWGAKATEAKVRLGQLDGSLLAVNKSSNAEALRAYIKGWQEVAQYSGASSEQIKHASENIAKANTLMSELMQERIDNAGKTNFAGKEYYSPAQVREAVEYLNQLSTTEKLTAEERGKLNASIKRGDEYLKQLTLDQQRYSMTLQLGGKQMANIKTLSDASLASQKKYWQEMVSNTKQGTAEYNQYLSTLKAVTDEEQRRASTKLRAEGGALVGQVNTGQFKGSIREIEEAIKKIQEYRRELSADTANGARNIETTEQALAKLNEKLAQTNTEVINGRKAFDTFGAAAKQGVDAVAATLPRSSDALKKMRSDLEAYKKSLKDPDPSKLQQIETIFTAIDKKEREVAADEIQWSKFNGPELKKRSLAELKKAYDVLKKEVEGMSPAQEKYNEKAMRMKQINEQVKRLNNNMSHHVSSLENAVSRLKNYVLIYFGFNAAMMKTRQVIQNIIELSDQMTNVQKVTQLATKDIEHMTNALQSLDTRTTNQQLMEMAEQAGKLGIATREGADGLVSFVKEGQKIINTLGDIGGAEAINELLKVNDVVNKNSQGLEKDLNKIGSAILNVGNNSKATYADVVEFTKRLGATGSVTGLTMEQIMGLGGAFSSLGESMERSATATQRVTLGIVSHTEAVAKSLNIGYDELDMLIQEGKAFEALTLVLKELGEQGPAVYDDFFKAIGGRNNVQARNAMALLSQHLQELNYQVALAEEGFEEGVLVTQEFERANNNLAGVVAQIGNEFYEMTTTVEGSNGALLTMAKWLLELTKSMRENNAIGGVLIATLLVLIKTLIVSSKAWYENAAAAALNDTTYQGFKGTFFGLIQIVVQSIKWIGFQTQALLGSATAAGKARLAAERLKIAWSSNWITLALVALGLLIGKLVATAKATSDAKKALGELIQKGEEEVAMLNSLYKSLQNVNLAQQDRANKINTFNRLFGSYLSNILTEENVAKRLGVAYREAAAAIREKNAAALEERAQQAAEEESGEGQREALGELSQVLGWKSLNKGEGLSTYDQSALIASLQAAVISAVEGGETNKEKILASIQKRLGSDSRFISKSMGSGAESNTIYQTNMLTGEQIVSRLGDNGERVETKRNTIRPGSRNALLFALERFIDATIKGEKAKQPFYQQAGGQRELAAQEEIALIEELRKEILEAQEKAKTPRAQRELYNNIMQYRRMYNKYKGDSRLPSEEGSFYSQFEQMLPELQNVVKPWGKTSIDMSGQAGKDMAIIVDYFNDIYNNWKEGQKILRTSAYKPPIGVTIPEDIDTWSKEHLRDWAYTNWQAAKKMQESENYDNPQGNFKDFHEKEGSKKERPESEEALAELKRYYSDREEVIEASYASGTETEEERNRKKLANDVEFYEKEAQLRKFFDGAMSAEEEKRFKEWWASKKDLEDAYWKDVENLRSTKWGVISAEWSKADAKVRGENRRLLQQDLTKRMTLLAEYQKKINAALLDYRPMEKVLADFRKSIDELDLLYGSFATKVERSEAGSAERRMDILHSFLSRMGSMTREEFSDELKKQKDFSKFTEKETFLLYERLLELRDKYEDAARKKAKKEMKLLDNRVESGEWYEEQLRLYNRYLDDRLDALAEAKKSEEQYRIAGEVASARTLIDYMGRRQNDDKGTPYVKREKAEVEELKARIKTEESIRNTGVRNDLKIAQMEVQVSARNLKTIKEQQVVRESLYKSRVRMMEQAVAQEKKVLESGTLTEEETLAHRTVLRNMETELFVTRQMNEEATKKTYEEVLEAERDFIAKESELMSQRIQNIQSIREGLNASLMEVISVASGVYESTQANIELEKYRLNIEGVGKEIEKTKYVIYNSRGIIEEVWLTPLEKLIKEQEIAIKNARSEAWNKYIDEISDKLNEAIESGINRHIALKHLEDLETKKNKTVEEMQKASLSIRQINEREAEDAIYAYKMEKLKEYLAEKDRLMAENRMRMVKAEASGGFETSGETAGRWGYETSEETAGRGGYDASGETAGRGGYDAGGGISWSDWHGVGGEVAGETTGGKGGGVETFLEDERMKQEAIMQTGMVAQTVAQQTTSVTRIETKKQTELSKAMFAAMIQGANLYGIAYATVADQNLNSQEKVNQIMLQSIGQMLNSVLSAVLGEVIAKIAASEGEMTAKAFGMNPWAAAGIIAAGTVALGAAMAMVKSKIAKGQSQIAAATGTSAGSGKLATGMLTYGKGRYPVYGEGFGGETSERKTGQLVSVRGNDGVNYMAKYQPNLRTGVVNEPHLGIVGEKGAELIVDHGTYENLKQYDPETLQRIYAMKQYGMRSVDFYRASRMGNEVLMNRGGVRAYADGNIESKVENTGMNGTDGGNDGTAAQMQQTLAELTGVLAAIKATGIPATMSYLGANGAQKQMEKGDKFLKRVGLKKN